MFVQEWQRTLSNNRTNDAHNFKQPQVFQSKFYEFSQRTYCFLSKARGAVREVSCCTHSRRKGGREARRGGRGSGRALFSAPLHSLARRVNNKVNRGRLRVHNKAECESAGTRRRGA
jgi:hypothetical protein